MKYHSIITFIAAIGVLIFVSTLFSHLTVSKSLKNHDAAVDVARATYALDTYTTTLNDKKYVFKLNGEAVNLRVDKLTTISDTLMTGNLTVIGNVEGTTFAGDGFGLTNLNVNVYGLATTNYVNLGDISVSNYTQSVSINLENLINLGNLAGSNYVDSVSNKLTTVINDVNSALSNKIINVSNYVDAVENDLEQEIVDRITSDNILSNRITTVSNLVVAVEGELAQEMDDRVAGDLEGSNYVDSVGLALSNRLDSVELALTGTSNSLAGSIASLGTNLSYSIKYTTAVSNKFNTAITNETAARIDSDSSISNLVVYLEGGLEQEIADRIAGDLEGSNHVDSVGLILSNRVSSVEDLIDSTSNELAQAISAEIQNRIAWDATNHNEIVDVQAYAEAVSNKFDSAVYVLATNLHTKVSTNHFGDVTINGELTVTDLAISNKLSTSAVLIDFTKFVDKTIVSTTVTNGLYRDGLWITLTNSNNIGIFSGSSAANLLWTEDGLNFYPAVDTNFPPNIIYGTFETAVHGLIKDEQGNKKDRIIVASETGYAYWSDDGKIWSRIDGLRAGNDEIIYCYDQVLDVGFFAVGYGFSFDGLTWEGYPINLSSGAYMHIDDSEINGGVGYGRYVVGNQNKNFGLTTYCPIYIDLFKSGLTNFSENITNDFKSCTVISDNDEINQTITNSFINAPPTKKIYFDGAAYAELDSGVSLIVLSPINYFGYLLWSTNGIDFHPSYDSNSLTLGCTFPHIVNGQLTTNNNYETVYIEKDGTVVASSAINGTGLWYTSDVTGINDTWHQSNIGYPENTGGLDAGWYTVMKEPKSELYFTTNYKKETGNTLFLYSDNLKYWKVSDITNTYYPPTLCDDNLVLSMNSEAGQGLKYVDIVDRYNILDVVNYKTDFIAEYITYLIDIIDIPVIDDLATTNFVNQLVNDLETEVNSKVSTNHVGDVEITGDVSATSFIGDGSQLSGVSGGVEFPELVVGSSPTTTTIPFTKDYKYYKVVATNTTDIVFDYSGIGDFAGSALEFQLRVLLVSPLTTAVTIPAEGAGLKYVGTVDISATVDNTVQHLGMLMYSTNNVLMSHWYYEEP